MQTMWRGGEDDRDVRSSGLRLSRSHPAGPQGNDGVWPRVSAPNGLYNKAYLDDVTGGSTSLSSVPPRAGAIPKVTSSLSTIPEHPTALHHSPYSHPSPLGPESNGKWGGRKTYGGHPLTVLHSGSDTPVGHLHMEPIEERSERMRDDDTNNSTASNSSKRWLKRNSVAAFYHHVDDSPSEDYSSSPSLARSNDFRRASLPVFNVRRGSLESTSGSGSLELNSLPGKPVRNESVLKRSSSQRLAPDSMLDSESTTSGSQRKSSSRTSLRRKSLQNGVRNVSNEERTPIYSKGLNGASSPQRLVNSSSSNSLKVPGRNNDGSGSGHPLSSRPSSVTLTVPGSEAARSSVPGSRRQSVFELGGSSVSAYMIAQDPAAAAGVAFSSLELPSDLVPTASKHLRQLFRPVVTCFLMVMLAGSLAAAVYFAVVLNKTQAEHTEFLRAKLDFLLDQASKESLTSMSTSERSTFNRQYCQEVSTYFQNSELSGAYRGCEVATTVDGKLSLLLYFDEHARKQVSNSSRTEDAILQVLASSAPRVGRPEDDVIAINNVITQLGTVDVSIEQTTDEPEFSTSKKGSSSITTTTTTSPSSTSTTTTANNSRKTSIVSDEDRLMHPCGPDESETYYRYPESCSLFFQCLDGRSITLGCGEHLIFDLDRKVCVPETEGCDVEGEREANFLTGVNVDPAACQQTGEEKVKLYPHPRVCNLYLQCSTTGSLVPRFCPIGLVFNAQLQNCLPLDVDTSCPQQTTNDS